MPVAKATDWVDCPICGESDMPFTREPDAADGTKGYIRCVNLNCGSNGGTNFNALHDTAKEQ